MEQLTEGERERLESWALLSQIARQRGAGSALPGNFPPDIEAEYQRLRAEFDSLRKQIENDIVDRPAHERFRDEARTLLRRLAESPSS